MANAKGGKMLDNDVAGIVHMPDLVTGTRELTFRFVLTSITPFYDFERQVCGYEFGGKCFGAALSEKEISQNKDELARI